jgi:hypothetical protein
MLKITAIGKQSWDQEIPSHPTPTEHGQPDWETQIDAATVEHPDTNQKSLNVLIDSSFFDTLHPDLPGTTIRGTSDLQDPVWKLFWKFFEAQKSYKDPTSLEYGVSWVLRDIESDKTNACGVHTEFSDDTTKGDWAFKPAPLGRGVYMGNIGMSTLRTQQYPFRLLIDGLVDEKLEIISINGQRAVDNQWSFKPGQSLTFRINAPYAQSVQMMTKDSPLPGTSAQSGAFLPWTVTCSFPVGTHDLGIQINITDHLFNQVSGNLGRLIISPDIPDAPVLEALGDTQHKTNQPVVQIAGQGKAADQVELIVSDPWNIHNWRISDKVNGSSWKIAMSEEQQLRGGIYRIAARCGASQNNVTLWSMPGNVQTINVDTSDQIYIDGVQRNGVRVTVWGHCSHTGKAELYGRAMDSKPVLLDAFNIKDNYWKASFTMDKSQDSHGHDPVEFLIMLPSGTGYVTSRIFTQ